MSRTALLKRVSLVGLQGVGAALLLCSTGCQVDVGGQTLPSPYYLKDDIQYFPTGPKFKLSREAAAMKAYAEQQNELAPPPAAQSPFPAAQ